MEKPIVLLSGGFDPYHDGHAKMFQKAAEIGEICVILNSDEWLIKKKDKAFMSLIERADVLNSVKGVEWIWHSQTLDDVSKDIKEIRNHLLYKNRFILFAKGGDRNASNTPEQAICEELGIPVIFGLGGDNGQSSSKLLSNWNICKKHLINHNECTCISVFPTLSQSTIESINAWSDNGAVA